MFGQITLETMQAWVTRCRSTVREERDAAIAELSICKNAHDHIKHRLGFYFVRAEDGEYIVVHDSGSGETEGKSYPMTLDGLRTATFEATVQALREIDNWQ